MSAREIPAGCYSTSQLRAKLRIKGETLRLYIRDKTFPAPAGYYESKNNRDYPYFNFKHVEIWLDGEIPPAPGQEQPVDDDSGWTVPYHSTKVKQQCLIRRQLDRVIFKLCL